MKKNSNKNISIPETKFTNEIDNQQAHPPHSPPEK